MIGRRQTGVTLVELVAVLTLMATLAVAFGPRLFERAALDARALSDAAADLLRLAQRQAMARGQPVLVHVTAHRLELCPQSGCGAGPLRDAAGEPLRVDAPDGLLLSLTGAPLSFSAQGRPSAPAELEVSATAGSRRIRIDGVTGLVRPHV